MGNRLTHYPPGVELGKEINGQRHHVDLADSQLDQYSEAVMKSLPDVAFVMDASGTLLFVSEKIEKYGYNPADLIHRRFLDLFMPEERERVWHEFRYALSSGDKSFLRTQLRTADGSLRFVEEHGKVCRDAKGMVTGLAGVLRDITMWEKAKRRYCENEDRFRKLFQSGPYAVTVADAETYRFVDVNKRALDLYGFQRSEFLSLTMQELTVSRPAQFDDDLESSLGFGRPVYWHCKKDGTAFPVEISRGCCTQNGRKLIYSIVRDLSDEMAKAQELNQQRERLLGMYREMAAAEGKERRRIAAGLHDEVAQLLAACQLKLGILKNMVDMPAVNDILGSLDEYLRRAGREIRDLTFELSSHQLEKEGLDSAIVELCKNLHRRYSLACNLRSEGTFNNLPIELCETVYIIVRELVANAGKHAQATHAEVFISRVDDHLHLSVTDNGCGFNPDLLRDAVSREGGYGLCSLRQRVLNCGGVLDICSAPGEGCTVVVELIIKAENKTPPSPGMQPGED